MEPQGKQQIIQQYQAMMDREKEMVQRVAELQAQESEYRSVSRAARGGAWYSSGTEAVTKPASSLSCKHARDESSVAAVRHEQHNACAVSSSPPILPSLNSPAPFSMRARARRLVAETIRPLEGGRKCFQLINGVLVERVVSEVLPIVDQNRDSVSMPDGAAPCGERVPSRAARRAQRGGPH